MEQRNTSSLAAGAARLRTGDRPGDIPREDVLRLLAVDPSVPPVCRGSMVARPWHGFRRGLLRMLAGSRTTPQTHIKASWQAAASRRRMTLAMLVLLTTTVGTTLMAKALPFDGSPLLSGIQLILFCVLFAWISAGFWSALMGFVVSLLGDRHAMTSTDLPRMPLDCQARTAIVMPICNEHVATVFAGLRAVCESLAATGALRLFDIYVLSDTRDEALQAEEYRAWISLRESLGDTAGQERGQERGPEFGRVFYRVRKRPGKRKAGNLADFCRRWGRNYRYMVVLDADSVMSGDSLVNLVRLMEANPRAGIIQTAPRACGHHTFHARAQQFASRITGPLFTAGMQFWQLGESHYWGHNAILRIAPFMKHCALAPLPGKGPLSGEILSHDFVEAALIRRAGYEVWVVPDIEGSYEQVPPNLIAELERDRRWCQGNLLNARLIAEPGIAPVHRAMFLTGVMAYLSAPLWFAYLLSGTAYWLFADPAADFPEGSVPGMLGWLWLSTAIMLMLPRALGVVSILLRGEQSQFGGTGKLCISAAIEAALSVLKAPIRMFAHTCFVLAALTGWRVDWQSPPREARALGYREVAHWFIGHTLLTLEWALLTFLANPAAVGWLLPVFIPLILAVPLTVASGNVRTGNRLREWHLLLTPEETAPPALLRSAWAHARRYAQPASRPHSSNFPAAPPASQLVGATS